MIEDWLETIEKEEQEKTVFNGWFVALYAPSPDGKIFPEGLRADPNEITPDSILPSYFTKKY